MNEMLDRSVWINYFIEFSRRNQARPTQLEVFGGNGAQKEEQGLLFGGIELEKGKGLPRVEIMFYARDGLAGPHLTHVIANVHGITPKRGPDGRDEALEIVGAEEVSLLRFKAQPSLNNKN
jgi:hypothetical protein